MLAITLVRVGRGIVVELCDVSSDSESFIHIYGAIRLSINATGIKIAMRLLRMIIYQRAVYVNAVRRIYIMITNHITRRRIVIYIVHHDCEIKIDRIVARETDQIWHALSIAVNRYIS